MLRKGIITILCAMCSTLLHADNNIEFESEDLEKIVKEAIGIENRKVTSADIDRLVELKCYGSKVHSLKGLESAQNLETLVFTHSNISNISAIEELKKLKVVKLSFNNITNIASLQNHKNILELYLNHNVIKDISPLENLENLDVT